MAGELLVAAVARPKLVTHCAAVRHNIELAVPVRTAPLLVNGVPAYLMNHKPSVAS